MHSSRCYANVLHACFCLLRVWFQAEESLKVMSRALQRLVALHRDNSSAVLEGTANDQLLEVRTACLYGVGWQASRSAKLELGCEGRHANAYLKQVVMLYTLLCSCCSFSHPHQFPTYSHPLRRILSFSHSCSCFPRRGSLCLGPRLSLDW